MSNENDSASSNTQGTYQHSGQATSLNANSDAASPSNTPETKKKKKRNKKSKVDVANLDKGDANKVNYTVKKSN